MSHINNAQWAKCHAIIHAASVSAGAVGAGLAQVPCSDNFIITPVQLAMTVSLGQVFGIHLTESLACSTLVSLAGATMGRAVSQLLVGWFPLVGNAINAGTAAVLTEALGWLVVGEFSKQAAET